MCSGPWCVARPWCGARPRCSSRPPRTAPALRPQSAQLAQMNVSLLISMGFSHEHHRLMAMMSSSRDYDDGNERARTVDFVAGKECQVCPRIPRRLHRRALRPGPILVVAHRDKQPRALPHRQRVSWPRLFFAHDWNGTTISQGSAAKVGRQSIRDSCAQGRDGQSNHLRQAPVVRVEAGLVADVVSVALEEAQQRVLRPCPRTQTFCSSRLVAILDRLEQFNTAQNSCSATCWCQRVVLRSTGVLECRTSSMRQ